MLRETRFGQGGPNCPPSSCGGAKGRGGAAGLPVGLLRWWRQQVVSAVGAPRAARTGPPRGHVEARPATLWPAPGTARSAAAAAAAAAAAWRSRSPPRLAHAGHGAAAVRAGSAARARSSVQEGVSRGPKPGSLCLSVVSRRPGTQRVARETLPAPSLWHSVPGRIKYRTVLIVAAHSRGAVTGYVRYGITLHPGHHA